MAHYPLRTTDDELAGLIDKAIAGEEVIITRPGKPAVELRVVADAEKSKPSKEEWGQRLRLLRASQTMQTESSADLIRRMRDEGIG